jgi:hypothetical protein
LLTAPRISILAREAPSIFTGWSFQVVDKGRASRVDVPDMALFRHWVRRLRAKSLSGEAMAFQTFGRMKSREEQLTWAKQRALICVGVGRFSDAVAGLRADLGKGAISSEHAMRGYKAAMDAVLGSRASGKASHGPSAALPRQPQNHVAVARRKARRQIGLRKL